MQTAMHTQPEDNQAAMAAQFAADVIVQRANAAALEWTQRPAAVPVVMAAREQAYDAAMNAWLDDVPLTWVRA